MTTLPSRLPEAYASAFDRMLATIAKASPDPRTPVVPFWPLRGTQYARELLVIGRSVNGWVEDWTVGDLRQETGRVAAVEFMRSDAEPATGNRMAWVTDLWGNAPGYSTARSAFWRVVRRIGAGDGDPPDDWPARLAWTNLYKVSPAAGWNPGADLQRVQRSAAIELLGLELEHFAPRRVLALVGNWIDPFRSGLGLQLENQTGLVEATGTRRDEAWVVAKHPMGKPGTPFVREVLAAFQRLGVPIAPTTP